MEFEKKIIYIIHYYKHCLHDGLITKDETTFSNKIIKVLVKSVTIISAYNE